MWSLQVESLCEPTGPQRGEREQARRSVKLTGPRDRLGRMVSDTNDDPDSPGREAVHEDQREVRDAFATVALHLTGPASHGGKGNRRRRTAPVHLGGICSTPRNVSKRRCDGGLARLAEVRRWGCVALRCVALGSGPFPRKARDVTGSYVGTKVRGFAKEGKGRWETRQQSRETRNSSALSEGSNLAQHPSVLYEIWSRHGRVVCQRD